MKDKFDLKVCFIGFKGGGYIREPEGDNDIDLLHGWVDILSRDVEL
jgi:hypothetical protein